MAWRPTSGSADREAQGGLRPGPPPVAQAAGHRARVGGRGAAHRLLGGYRKPGVLRRHGLVSLVARSEFTRFLSGIARRAGLAADPDGTGAGPDRSRGAGEAASRP